MKIAAIPTTYAGVRFRSRLEARWAATFDLLGWKWEYEPLDLDRWIPDFLVHGVPEIDKPLLVEVKPLTGEHLDAPPDDVRDKIERAIGAPPNEARRKPGEKYSWDAWERFFDETPYEYAVVGLRPFDAGDHLDGAFTAMCWHFERGMSWWPTRFGHPYGLLRCWIEAGNIVQWKAPK